VTSAVRRLVAIGGSWGGIAAVRSILPRLTLPPDAAVVAVLHRQPVRSALAEVLSRGGGPGVEEAEDKTLLVPGMVHVAPPDYHLLVERGWLALSTEEPVRYSRPSIDVLLESAAASFGVGLVAVMLTAASEDGTEGARAVHRHGGKVIVQDPTTAADPTMPRAVIAAGVADSVVALTDLPSAIEEALHGLPTGEGSG
jgi:two-component system, chemotaxis family, protein-glutamate methylesterase/glutaminase